MCSDAEKEGRRGWGGVSGGAQIVPAFDLKVASPLPVLRDPQ